MKAVVYRVERLFLVPHLTKTPQRCPALGTLGVGSDGRHPWQVSRRGRRDCITLRQGDQSRGDCVSRPSRVVTPFGVGKYGVEQRLNCLFRAPRARGELRNCAHGGRGRVRGGRPRTDNLCGRENSSPLLAHAEAWFGHLGTRRGRGV